MIDEPRDPFSEVVDERRRWLPDWYTWLRTMVKFANDTFNSIASQIATLTSQISALTTALTALTAKTAALARPRVFRLYATPSTAVIMHFYSTSGTASDGTNTKDFGAVAIDCDISVAGPAVNGRDQAGAFGATDRVTFHAIVKEDGTTNTLASLSDFAPTLPSGYVYSCYLFSVKLSGGNLPGVYISQSLVEWLGLPTAILAGGGAVNATPNTAVAQNAYVPDTATSVLYLIRFYGGTAASVVTLRLGVISGAEMFNMSANPGDFNGTTWEAVWWSDNIFYANDLANALTSIFVIGYREPNGAL